jgi:MFS transporter, FHS family, glucose/mannose:H+ symporter
MDQQSQKQQGEIGDWVPGQNFPEEDQDGASSGGSSGAWAATDWFVISLCYLSLFAFGLTDNTRGPVFPDLLREFSLSDSAGSFFFLTASGAALINNVFAFRLLERKGSYWVLQVYSVLKVVGILLMALGPTYPLIIAGAGIFGMGMGGLGIAQNILVAQASPPNLRRRILSGLHCMYGVASLLAPLYVTLLYRSGWGWRPVLAWLALGPAVTLVLSLKRHHKSAGTTASGANHRASSAAGQASPSEPRPWGATVYFATMLSLYVIAEICLGTRLVLLVRRDWGYDLEWANYLLSGFFLMMFAGRLLLALVPLRHSNSLILAVSLVFSTITFTMGLVHDPIWFVATGLAMSVFYPVAIALITDETGKSAGFITSWCITLQALGLMIMHFLLGGMSDLFGLGRALWIGPVCLVISLVFLMFKSRIRRFLPA